MIVVLDTNVFVAAMVAKGLCHEVVVRGLGSSTVATSQPLLDEVDHTLRAKFTLGPAGTAFLEHLRVRIVEPTSLSSPRAGMPMMMSYWPRPSPPEHPRSSPATRTFSSSVATTTSTLSLHASS